MLPIFPNVSSVSTTTDTSKCTNSPPTGSSVSSESPPASPAASQQLPQQQENPGSPTIPSQDLLEVPTVGQETTPSPSLKVLACKGGARRGGLSSPATRNQLKDQREGGGEKGPTRADSPIPQNLSEIPLQCMEDRPLMQGWQNGSLSWPYDPLSPAREFNSSPSRFSRTKMAIQPPQLFGSIIKASLRPRMQSELVGNLPPLKVGPDQEQRKQRPSPTTLQTCPRSVREEDD
ncbi:hypothetical protein EMCRGX_G005487 [Ephydatia muelleri]